MQWTNNHIRFGAVAIALHWLVALAVFGLFAVGWWMTGLDYYSAWYQAAPWWHKSVGLTLALIVLLRIIWRFVNPPPAPLETHTPAETRIAKVVHLLLYFLLVVTFISGYLISTADGRPIEVFGWFTVPATLTSVPNQEDIAGWIHWIVACTLMGLVGLHAMAALKHHFIDRDRSLLRILGR